MKVQEGQDISFVKDEYEKILVNTMTPRFADAQPRRGLPRSEGFRPGDAITIARRQITAREVTTFKIRASGTASIYPFCKYLSLLRLLSAQRFIRPSQDTR